MNYNIVRNSKVKLFAIGALSAVALISAAPAAAQYSNYSPYSPYGRTTTIIEKTTEKTIEKEITKQLAVNKQVKDPRNGNFVENLNAQEYNFLDNQNVTYKIVVTNNGQKELHNIKVTDKLPSELKLVSANGFAYDKNSKTLSQNLSNLKVGESKTFEIKAKTQIAKTKGGAVIASCPVNTVEVRGDNLFNHDQTQICVSDKVLSNVKTLPATGPSKVVTTMIGSAALFLSSIVLFKKSFSK